MDGSPIICKTPVEGLYFNGGWCYGGFKATPASGWCFAHTIAQGRAASAQRRSHDSTASATGASSTSAAPAPTPGRSRSHAAHPLPLLRPATEDEFHYRGDATVKRPASDAGEQRLLRLCLSADNPRGWHAEWWHHYAGCRQWLKVERNTLTHEIRAAVGARRVPSQSRRMSGCRLPQGGFIDRSRRSRSASTARRSSAIRATRSPPR